MDRLETNTPYLYTDCREQFTFQYGQIRNEFVNLSEQGIKLDLHSSMDRLETLSITRGLEVKALFTFQYGQIRN